MRAKNTDIRAQICRPLLAGLALTGVAVIALQPSAAAAAETKTTRQFNIQPQSLASALLEFSKQADRQVVGATDALRTQQTSGVSGNLTVPAALDKLLLGTGLDYQLVGERSVRILVTRPATVPAATAVANIGGSLRLAQYAPQDAQSPAKSKDTSRSSESESSSSSESKSAKSENEEVVVTGSRIKRPVSQVAANVIVLDAKDLRATGESTLEKALRQLPQNVMGTSEVGTGVSLGGQTMNGAINITGASTINLRGLGSESTLVLIDGRRMGKSGMFGGVSDISGIPLSSVDRVEIMLDGASSIYGSDAIGGVVNIILRKDYNGGEAMYSYGVPEAGGFEEHTVTLSGGTTFGDGFRVRGTAEFFHSTNLDGLERPERVYSNRWSSPGGIQGYPSPLFYSYNGHNYTAAQITGMGLTTTSPGVVGAVYTQLPSGQNGDNLTLDDFPVLATTSVGPGYNEDIRGGMSLIPASDRRSVQGGVEKDFHLGSEAITFSASLSYADRHVYAGQGNVWTTFDLAADDPRNPFGQGTTVYWELPEIGVEHFQTVNKTVTGNFAFDGAIGAKWNWQLEAGRSHDTIDSTFYNAPNFTQPEELNFMASDLTTVNSPAVLDSLVDRELGLGATNQQTNVDLTANGEIFRMPGGNTHLAVGVEWRKDELTSETHTNSAGAGGVVQTAGEYNGSLASGAYDSSLAAAQRSVFAEILLPLFGAQNAMTGFRQLDLTGAARHDIYDVYGNSNTWSAGLVWSPVQSLRLKFNQSTSFVVPTPREGLGDTTYFDYAYIFQTYLDEPGLPVDILDSNGVPTGEQDYIGTLVGGANHDLKPQTAVSRSAGFQFTPQFLPGLMLDVTWHDTDYKNRITAAPDDIIAISGIDIVDANPNFSRDANGLLIWDNRAINAAEVKMAGIDYLVRYNHETSIGQFVSTLNVAYTDKFEQIGYAGDAPVNRLAHMNGNSAYLLIPHYRYAANVGWYDQGWSVVLNGTTATDISSSYAINAVNVEKISSTPVRIDILLGYDLQESPMAGAMPGWMQGSAISLKVLNITDDQPGTKVIDTATGDIFTSQYNANYADPRGRMFYLNLTKRF